MGFTILVFAQLFNALASRSHLQSAFVGLFSNKWLWGAIGLSIVLPHEQAPNTYVTPDLCFNFHYFAIRKMHFLMRAKVITIFPGGFGTLDEMFEALTLIQTGRMRRVPFLLFGGAFWKEIVNWQALVEAGTISPDDLDLIRFVETADEAVEIIDAFDFSEC